MNENLESTFVIRPSWNNYLDILSIIAAAFYCAGYIKYVMPTGIVPDFVAPLFVVIGTLFLMIVVIRRYSMVYSLIDGRLICNKGLISRNESSIRLADVRAVHLQQGIIDRLMNTGDVSFSSAAQSDADIVFKGVDDPKNLRDRIQNLMSASRTSTPA
ncbi:PH domain-containing protein [Allochromatium humboldtianum]|uniref:PH domain-containing protein n=1 Tax=Allochromatium humboldtianum TaxID=504901 RepID=A0A850RES3_9GAMM|nr:PH domain-containing protein [Allochromatium humboldtianum]NVZ11495.1 PH domain-containing protein [Allochromatium humboldtianum]